MMPAAISRVLLASALVTVAIAGPQAQVVPQQDLVRVIVAFRQTPGQNEAALLRAAGGVVRHTFWLTPAIAVDLPAAAVQALRNNPAITSVDLDVAVHEVDAELDAAWGVKHVGSGVVHDTGNKGGGVRVCVIDSGVDYVHPDLAPNFLGGYDFVNRDGDPFDDRGHGTHVTGTVLARDDNAGVVGVAPDAWVLAYKILNQDGAGYISDAIAALQDCIAAGGQVTNSSFGAQSDPGPAVKAAYDNAEALGLVSVAAAGNRTTIAGTCTSVAFPARYSSVIAVTSTDSKNTISSTSCRGPEAELAAPGVNINSTVPSGSCAYCASSGYRASSGTSMASPHVAGAAALVIASGIYDANGNGRINDEVRQRLQATADDLGTAGRDGHYGYGLVDADEAAPPAPLAPPSAPTSLSATTVSSSQINLTWTDNSSNESGFKIERCTGSPCGSGFAQIATTASGATSYSNPGLQSSTTYTYRVRAYNSGGDSAFSNEYSATTGPEEPPSPPSSVSAAAVSASRIDLTWSDTSSNEIGFRIERCQGVSCTFSRVATVQAGATSYSDTGLTASSSYSYRLAAESAVGDSAYSNIASATTLASSTISLSASGYKVQGKQRVDLSWSGATSSSVDVFRNGGKVMTTTNDGFEIDQINSKGGASYTYQLCEAGTSTCSDQVTVTF